MSGISSSGLISGIDTSSLIEQLIAISARPRASAQRRLGQLQTQQAAYLDVSSRLRTFRTAAQEFRTSFTFDTKRARSSNESVLTASSRNEAAVGSYQVLVDRLVSTQQRLSTGFTDRDTSAFGASSFTFEPESARLATNTALSELNGGGGVRRGILTIRDQSGTSAEVDLSRAGSVNEVLDAINNAATDVTARVDGGRFVLENVAQVTAEPGSGTADDLGLSGSPVAGTLTGSNVYGLRSTTALRALNDGNGVELSNLDAAGTNFTINVTVGATTTAVNVRLGEIRGDADSDPETPDTVIENAPSTVGGVVGRINAALADAGFGTTVAVDENAGGLRFTTDADESIAVIERSNNNAFGTARDLGIRGLAVGTAASGSGEAIIGGLNTVLLKNLGGGNGTTIAGTGLLDIRLRSGDDLSIDLSSVRTVADAITAINSASDAQVFGQLRARVNDAGTGLEITDTSGGPGNLIVADNATSQALGLATEAAGVASDTFGGNSQRRYISGGSLLSSLNGGEGVGTGGFRITTPSGIVQNITVDSSTRTIRDLIDKINSAPGVTARINDTGDGLLVEATETGSAISIEDTSGNVARSLKIAGTVDLDEGPNQINGRFETTVEFDPTDTLNDAVTKINSANAGVRVSVVNDGGSIAPFRLSFVSTRSGSAGRVAIDTGAFDLGITETDRGNDARVFFGGNSAASSLLVTSSSNTLDDLIDGVNIDLQGTNANFVTLTVESDTEAIEEKVGDFIDAYNTVLTRIDFQTRFVPETEVRGPLQGDSTLFTLRNTLASTSLSRNRGFSGRYDRLAQIGITFGDGGTLELDTNRFRDALLTDRDAVEELFTRRQASDENLDDVLDDEGNVVASVTNPSRRITFDELGVIPLLEQLADTYTNSIDGVFTLRNTALDNQISGQQDRIASLTTQLDNQRQVLARQFVQMEQALAQLQSQQSALSSLVPRQR